MQSPVKKGNRMSSRLSLPWLQNCYNIDKVLRGEANHTLPLFLYQSI